LQAFLIFKREKVDDMKDIFSKKFLMMALVLIGIFAIGITIQNLMNPQKLPKVTKSQIVQLESSTFPTEK